MDSDKTLREPTDEKVIYIGTWHSDTVKGFISKSANPVQVFTNGNGCRVGVLAYCTELTGDTGAQNLVDALIADGRFGSVALVDGDVVLPTAQYLLNNFDAVIAVTDYLCGIPMPQAIADAGAEALAGFALGGGGVVLTAFAFSTSIGFGNAIFAPGLSPFQRVQEENEYNSGELDFSSIGTDPACKCIFNGVTPPVTINPFFSNAVTLSPGATLCAKYTNALEFAAVNSTGNIIGLNTFPFYSVDLQQESYRRIIENALLCVCKKQASRGIDFTKFINSII